MICAWVSTLAIPLAVVGFSRGVRAAGWFAGAAGIAAVFGWLRGDSAGALAGCVTVFALLPWLLGRMEKEVRAEVSHLALEEVSNKETIRLLAQEEEACQIRIEAQEEAVREIGELYKLSKEFLGTLEMEQGLQRAGEFLGRWFPGMTDPVRASVLVRVSELADQETVTSEALTRILPVHSGDRQERERWAIAAEQLALGLQRLCLYRTVEESATHDGLTGLLVRRYFLQRFRDELERVKRRSAPAAFLMIDLDRFKTVNDTYGHLVGDVVLREVAQQIRSSVREVDLVGRYGGEEFEVVLPEADLGLSLQIAERIRRAVESAVIRAYDEEVRITVSIGVSIFPQDAGTPAELIEKADEALYRAKESGRNKTIAWEKK